MAVQTTKRILGLDYGIVRIGVALSDESRRLATPLVVIENKPDVLTKIWQLILKHSVGVIVLGLPYHADGTDSPMTMRVREFADELREKTQLPVELCDERYSTMDAQETLIASGKGRKRRQQKGELDKRAAAIILQDYLDTVTR